MNSINAAAGLRMVTLESRFGLHVAARLGEGAQHLPHDVNERLRHARTLALARHRTVLATQPDAVVVGGGSSAAALSLGGGVSDSAWWPSLSALIPLVALLVGFYLIDRFHVREQIAAAAEIDAALLADDLPPEAYSDPGFVEFLRTARD